jgi:Second Messenger Oligonucleotide or Dinucleotide Synthetase domain
MAESVVGPRFDAFLENIRLTSSQTSDGEIKHKNVRNCLNQWYYNLNSDTGNSRLVGSWGKSTRVRPPRDIDVLFELPYEVYQRYQNRTGNKQSQLLQEVRDILLKRFTNTAIKGDGPAVVIPFQSFKVELVPAIKLTNGQYWICITKAGGTYKTFDPSAEIEHVKNSDDRSKGNTRALIRMAKVWQACCSVPIKSFHLELLAVNFLGQWQYFDRTTVYYDWMVRDFFAYIKEKDWTSLHVPGTGESMILDNSWKSRAESAYDRAVKACDNDADGYPYLAGEEWQKIFGTAIPMHP